MRPDLLSGLNTLQRFAVESAASEFIKNHKDVLMSANPLALEKENNTFAGVFKSYGIKPYNEKMKVDFVICARVDLDHPIYFPDNLFTVCEDCGCDLQHRPDVPDKPRICVCCAARRIVEDTC